MVLEPLRISYLDDIVERNEDNFFEMSTMIQPDYDEFDFMGMDSGLSYMNEAKFDRYVEKLTTEILDVNKFVKDNDFKEITNPNFFLRDTIPTPDGLLSNEIFGITKDERSGIGAYIDLHGTFMDPSCYKAWSRMDSRIKNIVFRTKKYIIKDGDFVEDEKGSNGIKFLKDNFDKIILKATKSRKRDMKIQYLAKNKNRMFITKYPVIPPYYRDVNTGGKYVGVGEINRLYNNLLVSTKALAETQDYGINNSGAIEGRIQEIMLTIYDWFIGNNNAGVKEEGTGLSRKLGLIRRSNMSKTADYASRLVLSAPELKVETLDDVMVDLDHCALPLAAACACFYPFVLFHIRRFFENEFMGQETYPVIENGKVVYKELDNPLMEFSDERIQRELKRFLHGWSDRFRPIEIPIKDSKKKFFMAFKGRTKPQGHGSGPQTAEDFAKNPGEEAILNRRLTWCDVFYRAAVEATKDKIVLVTRFPIDSYYNQFPQRVRVSSTNRTEPMMVGNEFYRWYPYIREEDIGKDTSNKFIDTLQISNLHLGSIGGDYDGDQVSIKGSFFEETNKELEEYLNSKRFYLDPGAQNVRTCGKEALQSIYNLTRIIDKGNGKKLSDPKF